MASPKNWDKKGEGQWVNRETNVKIRVTPDWIDKGYDSEKVYDIVLWNESRNVPRTLNEQHFTNKKDAKSWAVDWMRDHRAPNFMTIQNRLEDPAYGTSSDSLKDSVYRYVNDRGEVSYSDVRNRFSGQDADRAIKDLKMEGRLFEPARNQLAAI